MSSLVIQNIHNILRRHLPGPSSTLILALSGGPDSVCLLHILNKLKPELKFNLILAHFNHNLRGAASDLDEKFVKNLAKRLKLPIEIGSSDVKSFQKKYKLNLEEAGRILRYQFLKQVRKKHHADFILTAHHLNDNIETVLLNLIRGTSFRGLKGMEIRSGYLLRPLLNIPKDKILKYLIKEKLNFRIDESNFNLNFKRNYLRHKIIPIYQKNTPDWESRFLKFIKLNRQIFQSLEKKAKKWFENNFRNNSFENKKFSTLRMPIQKQILSDLYCQFYGSTKELTGKQLTEIINLIKKNKTGAKKRLGKNYEIHLQYNKIQIYCTGGPMCPPNITNPLPLKIPGLTIIHLNSQKYQIHAEFIDYLRTGERPFAPTIKTISSPSKIPNSPSVIYLSLQPIYPAKLKERRRTTYLSGEAQRAKADNLFIRRSSKSEDGQPIFVRSWLPGDKIQPLGMKGYKKLQDIFTDKKIPQTERQNIPIFVDSKNNILAVGHLTISEKHKIIAATKKALKIQIR